MYHLFASQGFGATYDGPALFDPSTFIGFLYRVRLSVAMQHSGRQKTYYKTNLAEAKASGTSQRFPETRCKMGLASSVPMTVTPATVTGRFGAWPKPKRVDARFWLGHVDRYGDEFSWGTS